MQRHYKLRPSRWLSLIVSLSCASALVCLWVLPLQAPVLIILAVAVLCWTGYCLLRDATLRLQHSCVAFRLEEAEGIVLVLRSGRHLPGRVLLCSLVTPYLVILNVALGEPGGRKNVLVLPDAMSKDSFRRLRIALRWGDRGNRSASTI